LPRVAATILLPLLFAAQAPANSGGVPEASAEIVTYEVAAQEIVIREVPPQLVVIKEIAPQEPVRKTRARKEAKLPELSLLPLKLPKLSLLPLTIPGNPDLATFLDRLMAAESGGRDSAANPLSTALGPFQFIKSTFIDIARRHFPELLAEHTDEQVLALRTTRHFARSAAEAYTLENAAHLKSQGHEPTWPHLRLAFLLGPTGASRVLQAPQDTPLSQILSASVLQANPFMIGKTATDLVARAARDVSAENHSVSARSSPTALVRPEARARPAALARPGTPGPAAKPEGGAVASIKISCNQKLVSCQRWVSLQKQKQKKQKMRNAESASGKGGKG